MPVMLQVRNLPDDIHAKLKKRAADSRMTLSDYVTTLLAKHVARPTNAEVFAESRAKLAALGLTREERRALVEDATRWIREERDARG